MARPLGRAAPGRGESFSDVILRVAPPGARAAAEALIAKGFDARWRFNRDGSPRFRVAGGPARARHVKGELTAGAMNDRYFRFL